METKEKQRFVTEIGVIDPKYVRSYDCRQADRLLKERNELLKACKQGFAALKAEAEYGHLENITKWVDTRKNMEQAITKEEEN